MTHLVDRHERTIGRVYGNTSSSVASVVYDAQSRELEVGYQNAPDTTYIYLDVPEDVFESLMDANSAGGFLAKTIKPHYLCERKDVKTAERKRLV